MKTYPIYKVKAKHSVTLANNANHRMNILVGDIGTFQVIDNPMNSGDKMIEALFNRPIINGQTYGVIRFYAKSPIPVNGDIRQMLAGEFEIIPQITKVVNGIRSNMIDEEEDTTQNKTKSVGHVLGALLLFSVGAYCVYKLGFNRGLALKINNF